MGENLTRHVHTDSPRVDNGIHSACHLRGSLVRPELAPILFEAQCWPIAWGCATRETYAINSTRSTGRELEDTAEDLDVLICAPGCVRAQARARGGGSRRRSCARFLPGPRRWKDVGRAGGRFGLYPSVRFSYERSERDVAVHVFLDAVRGLVEWVLERIAPLDGAVPAADKEAFWSWLSALDSPSAAEGALLGYAGVDKESILAAYTTTGRAGAAEHEVLEQVFELEPGWQRRGAQFDAQSSGAAIVFRGLLPTMSVVDILGVLDKLRAFPANPGADEALRALQKSLPPLDARDRDTDYWQGYRLAEAVRAYLGNPDSRLDIEGLLRGIGINVEDVDLEDTEIDGGAVWDNTHGPVLLVNRSSVRARVVWGRRMVLAHELPLSPPHRSRRGPTENHEWPLGAASAGTAR